MDKNITFKFTLESGEQWEETASVDNEGWVISETISLAIVEYDDLAEIHMQDDSEEKLVWSALSSGM